MNRQSRASRWLRVLELAQALTESILASLAMFGENGRSIPPELRMQLVRYSRDAITLAAVADPPIGGTQLAEQLHAVMARAGALEADDRFESSVRGLLDAIEGVLPELRETVVDDVESAEDIVTELERSFMVSLTLSLSAHSTTGKWVAEWEQEHMRFLTGKRHSDVGHYRSIRPVNPGNEDSLPLSTPTFWADEPGPGRIHVQHLIAAINSGFHMMVAGAGVRSVDYYPEVQVMQYGQWFAYMHAVWEEQFRDRLAQFWSRDLPDGAPAFRPHDVINDFFGDIRLIRNDFVHNKGEAKESLHLRRFDWTFEPGEQIRISVERMVEMMEKFPRDQLLEPPARRESGAAKTTQGRTSMPSSGKTALVEEFQAIVASKNLSARKANDDMLRAWIEQNR